MAHDPVTRACELMRSFDSEVWDLAALASSLLILSYPNVLDSRRLSQACRASLRVDSGV